MPKNPIVAGESAAELLEIMRELDSGTDDETASGSPSLPPDRIVPLLRALMRVEAALLFGDASRVGTPQEVVTTPEERRHDAFVILALRTAEACRG